MPRHGPPTGTGLLHVEAGLAGRSVRGDARVEEQPERRVAWHALGGGRAEGAVELRPVEGAQTLDTLSLERLTPGVPGDTVDVGLRDRDALTGVTTR